MSPFEPQVLKLIEELDELGETRSDAWQIPREEGELLHQIALAHNAKRIVEVGTSYGFSGLFWGSAIKRLNGHLHTIDRDPKKYDQSKLTFAKAGLNEVITNYLGDAEEILAVMPGPIDIAFLDAEKSATRRYFHLVWPKIRFGGSVLTDNATTHRSELAELVGELRTRADAVSVEVAVGNGLEWTVKVG
jgi:caffeoyl-CoA O-methyltransferase